MKYKEGDQVKIKSLDWYNENKDKMGRIRFKYENFIPEMSQYCGEALTIKQVEEESECYLVSECGFAWTDEMIEGLVEEETKPKNEDEKNGEYETNGEFYSTIKYLVRPNGYQFVDEDGNVINVTKIVLEKKKKEYPKTYEECCKVLDCKADHFFTDFSYKGCDVEISDYEDKIDDLLQNFRKLRYCRDAYWKIYGKKMGLGKPWEPSKDKMVYSIYRHSNKIETDFFSGESVTFEFPTKEMRDAFKENFDPDIEFCKELL